MDAGYELPLPAAQIVEHLNVRPRIPLSPWSLKVTSVVLVARPDRTPLVQVLLETSSGAGSLERWSALIVLDPGPAGQPQAFLLFLKVRLEEWWLNRAGHPEVLAQRLS